MVIGHNAGPALYDKPPTWTPLDLGSKLVGYVDFADNSRVTKVGDKFSSATDRVSSAAFVQATDANRPAVAVNSVMNRQVGRFNGTTTFMSYTGIPTGWPTGANPGELIAIVSQDNPSEGAGRIAAYGGGSAATARNMTKQTLSNSVFSFIVGASGGGSVTATVSNPIFNGVHLIRAVAAGTQAAAEIDGVISAWVAVVPNTGTTRAVIGAVTGMNSNFFLGDIAIILVTNAVLTDAELNNLYVWAGAILRGMA